MTKQVTERQHWVPQFYLRKFVNPDGKLERLKLRANTIGRALPPKSVCWASFFYGQVTGECDEASQLLEDVFTLQEDEFAKYYEDIYLNLISGEAIREDYAYLLSAFMASLWIRSSYVRLQIESSQADLSKSLLLKSLKSVPEDALFKMGSQTLNQSERSDIIKKISNGEFELKPDNLTHLMLIKDLRHWTHIFAVKKWRIYIIKGDRQFTTSDTPVIEVHPPRRGFYSPSIFQRKQYFAFSPDVLIELINPVEPGKQRKRKTFYQSNPSDMEKVTDFNIARANNSVEFLYAQKKEELENLTRYRK